MSNWLNDLNRSNRCFCDLVWPVIGNYCGGGIIRPVEILRDNEIAADLDHLCGIDVWQRIDGVGCRGIASRVQFGNRNWRTFTIRQARDSGGKTEYQKRMEAIHSGGQFLYPYLTVQAYADTTGKQLLGCAVASTDEIFKAISDNRYTIRRTSNASFYVIKYEDVYKCNFADFYL